VEPPNEAVPPDGAGDGAQAAIRRGLRYPLGARLFFWLDILLGAVAVKLALTGGMERSDPRVLLLALPVAVTLLCLTRAIPYVEYLAYLRIPYALALATVLAWPGIRQLHPPALGLVGALVLWHAGYALAVRAYQQSKARLKAARELLAADEAAEGDAGSGAGEVLTPRRQERQE
jgi:hypothetical protein